MGRLIGDGSESDRAILAAMHLDTDCNHVSKAYKLARAVNAVGRVEAMRVDMIPFAKLAGAASITWQRRQLEDLRRIAEVVDEVPEAADA